ncbi:hypothetical protein AAC387_Pa01g3318 [Persea americana]
MVFQGCSVMDGLGHSKAFEMVKIGDQIHTSGEKRKHAFESEDSTSDVGAGEDGKQKEIGMPSIDEGHWRSNHVASADRCPSSQSTRCNCKLAMSGRQDKGVDYFKKKILFDETIQRNIVVKPPVSLRCDMRESLPSDESCSVLPKGQEVEAPKPLDITTLLGADDRDTGAEAPSSTCQHSVSSDRKSSKQLSRKGKTTFTGSDMLESGPQVLGQMVKRPTGGVSLEVAHGPISDDDVVLDSQGSGVPSFKQSSDGSIPSSVVLRTIGQKHIRFIRAARARRGRRGNKPFQSTSLRVEGNKDDSSHKADAQGFALLETRDGAESKINAGNMTNPVREGGLVEPASYCETAIVAAATEEAFEALDLSKRLGISCEENEAEILQQLIEVEVAEIEVKF